MSFGRRLALFFVLIAIVPATALIAILLLVSQDSERGKSDARIAAGLQTAIAVYGGRVDAARSDVQRLTGDPALTTALRGDRAQLEAWTRRTAHQPGVARVELFDRSGTRTAAAGPVDCVAFAQVGLTENLRAVGALRLSATTGERYVTEVKRLTQRELVLRNGDRVLAATVTPPERTPGPDETADLTAGGAEYRGHELSLNSADGETLLILGPRDDSGLFGIGGPALGILAWFLVTAVALAWALARALTRLHQRLETQASTDHLTGLWNRRYMADTLEREVSRALRFGHPVSLIILDVDDFKGVNDRQGHPQGDLVLERVADVVREATRSIDVAARYGGDELALILVETDRQGATILGERLGERMRETQVPLRDGGSMGVTISVGVATLPDSADDVESLVDAADRALLSAKRAGKNQLRTAPVTKARSGGTTARHLRQPAHRTTRQH